VVNHQPQVERRTAKIHLSETDVLPLCHATNQPSTDVSKSIKKFYWQNCPQDKMAVFRLLSTPIMSFSPPGATDFIDKMWRLAWLVNHPLPYAEVHIYRCRTVGLQPPELSKFEILPMNATLMSWSRGSLTLIAVFLRVSSTKPLTSGKHAANMCKGKGTSLRTPTMI